MIKKHILFLLVVVLSINCYSQVSFEKGYLIDNNNHKINCLIKNLDWRNNPTEFEYKLSEHSDSRTATIDSVKEFGIDSISKYVRLRINIDRSGEDISKLSNDKNPLFNEEELFLKVLVEGKSNLYGYTDGNLRRYFYTKENSEIEQLIFKNYRTNNNHIGENNSFRQQLWTYLKCPDFKMSRVKNIDYNKNDLVRFFTDYNKCHDSDFIIFGQKQERDGFNLTIRPRINSTSLSISNSNTYTSQDTDFENSIGFGIGIEAEFILPFYNNKWAITIEPTYHNYKAEKTTDVYNVSGGKLITTVNYRSIEIPVSLRHYFFLSNTSKIFINASYIVDLNSNSSIEFNRKDGTTFNSLEINSRNNLALGMGYKRNNRYSLEIRYYTSREVLGSFAVWNSDYKVVSLIFGYSIF